MLKQIHLTLIVALFNICLIGSTAANSDTIKIKNILHNEFNLDIKKIPDSYDQLTAFLENKSKEENYGCPIFMGNFPKDNNLLWIAMECGCRFGSLIIIDRNMKIVHHNSEAGAFRKVKASNIFGENNPALVLSFTRGGGSGMSWGVSDVFIKEASQLKKIVSFLYEGSDIFGSHVYNFCGCNSTNAHKNKEIYVSDDMLRV